MATISDLKAVLKETLEKKGVLGQLKARVRAEVFEVLDDHSEPKPALSHENLLINELIREYLEFNKYKYTASVLTAETGLSDIPLDRSFLAKEMNIVEDANSQTVPILYGILSHFLKGREDHGQCLPLLKPPADNLRPTSFGSSVPDTRMEPVRMAETSTAKSYHLHGVHTEI
ncbi:centrosomal protein 20 [Discoglossus pictus]